MKINYKQLSLEDRFQIQRYLYDGLSHHKIAKIMGVSNSTISREIKRNSTILRRPGDEKLVNKYYAKAANTKYIHRRAKNRVKASSDILNIIYDEVSAFNSLSSIADKWKTIITDFPFSTTLYLWVKCGVIKLPKKYTDSYKLKRRKSTYKSQSFKKDELTEHISKRNRIIDKRKHSGHWELDLIESPGNGGYIISFIERQTRFTLTKYIDNKTSSNVNSFIRTLVKTYKVNSITTDNGSEFNRLYELKKTNKNLKIFYCTPGAPYQKGQVEWFNKQLRRFIKKHSIITKKSIRRISYYTKCINNQFLKVLNFHSPFELEYLIKK